MASVKALLGNQILDVRGGVSWVVREGTMPHFGVFTLDKEKAKFIKDGSSVDLVATVTISGKTETLHVQKLRVVGRSGTIDPYSTSVVVADVRWEWNRKHVRRTFNKRRRSGDKRRLSEDGEVPAEVAPTVDDVTYAEASLEAPKKVWTAQSMVASVLDEVIGASNWPGAASLSQFHGKAVDNVEIDNSGDAAVDIALSYLPGAGIYVGIDGKVRIKNELDQTKSDYLMRTARLGHKIVGGGEPAFVSLAAQRPFEIDCLFDVEQEVRFDYLAGRSSTSYGDERYMVNVAPVPDATLKMVSGPLSGKTVVRGTWVRMEDLIAAWNANKDGATVPNLTDAFIRQFWDKRILEATFVQFGSLSPNVSWAARIQTIRQRYRQTFRISHRWMSRIYSMRAYRCSVYDSEAGTFGASVAYMDYSILYGSKGLAATDLGKQGVGVNVAGGRPPGLSLVNSRVAPAVVSIIDGELGIIKVDLVTDLAGNVARVLPGQLDKLPSVHPRGTSFPITSDGSRHGRGGYTPGLIAMHRCNVILTVAPFSPNNTKRLYTETVKFADAKDYLPGQLHGSLEGASGPRWQIRIGAGTMTARFPWIHSKASAIEQSFGVGRPLGADPKREGINEYLMNPFEIRKMARAMAAGLYASMSDHWEGSKRIPLNSIAEPEGRIRAVAHTVGRGGSFTSLSAPENQRPVDGTAFLPTSTRILIGRQIQP